MEICCDAIYFTGTGSRISRQIVPLVPMYICISTLSENRYPYLFWYRGVEIEEVVGC